jgi:predicted N-acyltransferase
MPELLKSASELPEDEWDAFCGGRPYLSRGWLITVAESSRTPPDYRFLLIREGRRLLGAAACYLGDDGAVLGDIERRIYGRAASRARLVGLGLAPALVCGIGAAHGGTAILVSPDLSADEQARVALELVEALEDLARREGRSLVFNNVLEHEPWRALLDTRGYVQAIVTPSVIIPVTWNDFEGYLGYVRAASRNAYDSIRTERKRFGASGAVIVRTPPGEAGAAEAYELLAAHHERKNDAPFPLTSHFVASLARHCAGRAVFYRGLKDGRLLATALVLEQDRAVWAAFAGVDLSPGLPAFAYFNVVMYAPIEQATAPCARELVLGPGVYEAKLARGGKLVRRYVLVKRSGFLRQAATGRVFQAQNWWHPRKFAPIYARDRQLAQRRARSGVT